MKVINMGTKAQASFYVACELYKEMAFKAKCNLGLATGGTMTDLYQQLSQLLNDNHLNVNHVTTFNLDEYIGLAKDHNQSYHYYMNKVLFENYPHFKEEQIFIPNGVAQNEQREAKQYEQLLKQSGPRDIQILGIGENGHIGFNEPGTAFDSQTGIVNLSKSTIEANSRYFDHPDDVPRQAISMGLSSILQAKRIILLAFGAKKKQAISNMLNLDPTTDVPATILQTHPNVEIYLDTEATPDHLLNKTVK
ncbi:glucosamine-6-phosphate deaminase [Staphylococcus simiae]|uniref:glucosamine-6-phosphate deaminase n=1 Tax=Staphylococcus simiae TaxID=308354 RepID=UPI001A959799|nr:glucosamine-6-phosphate deaminase [Staphylococcus simiae]MBO1199253.1 glucosamine-6-phosphate deaminase [Staphylococcus simiae]MBO1201453.1 glucosamine-6-phosphate deaminase [Staphylococcus simiae]MBO1203578.1 glucosamine-6-phosphate deaminase [Staphylococcus simiae]MBO1211224.1 glucosamine-6-phosphate deaminase [Staphylococcus simiae]MBO1229812.1 glucosamine-6-phosphate deaminase [Staphylococcus simiae]